MQNLIHIVCIHCLLMLIATTAAISFVVAIAATIVTNFLMLNQTTYGLHTHTALNIIKHIYKYSRIIKFNIKGICVLAVAVFVRSHILCVSCIRMPFFLPPLLCLLSTYFSLSHFLFFYIVTTKCVLCTRARVCECTVYVLSQNRFELHNLLEWFWKFQAFLFASL